MLSIGSTLLTILRGPYGVQLIDLGLQDLPTSLVPENPKFNIVKFCSKLSARTWNVAS